MTNQTKMVSLIAFNLIVCLISIFGCMRFEGYELMPLYPLALIAVILLPNFRKLAKNNIGIKVLYLSMWVKYSILPLCISLSNVVAYRGVMPSSDSISKAIILQIIEILVVAIVVETVGRKLLLRYSCEKTEMRNSTPVVEGAIIMIAIAFLILHPDLISNFSFLVYNENTDAVSYFRGLDVRLIQLAIILAFCIIIRWAKTKSATNSLYFIVALFVGTLAMLVFKGDNRASLLINIVSVAIVMMSAYPTKKRTIINFIFIIGTTALVLLSLYKIIGVTDWRPDGGSIDLSFEWVARVIQAYLSGPGNVAQGLEAMEVYPGSLKTFFSDILVWSGYFGNFISEAFGIEYEWTSQFFNMYIYNNTQVSNGGDQIIPMVVQSVWYFGYLGSMIFSAICASLVVVFDRLVKSAKSFSKLYITTMMSVVTGLMLGYNVTIVSMYFFDRYLIFWLIITIAEAIDNRLFAKKRGV